MATTDQTTQEREVPATSVLDVDDIHTYYGESYVLQGLTLDVPRDGVTAILGRNGMGKTTLIRSIAGFTPPRRGDIRFNGRSIARLPSYQIARAGIGLVPQGRRLFPSLTVYENLALVTSRLSRPYRGNGRQRVWTLDSVLDLFPQLADRRGQAAGTLSGGEKQMLAIARALLNDPELVLMDEPSEGLSPVLVDQVEGIVRTLVERGYAILLVEQRYDLAVALAHTVYVITNGRVVFRGTPDELEADANLKAEHLGI